MLSFAEGRELAPEDGKRLDCFGGILERIDEVLKLLDGAGQLDLVLLAVVVFGMEVDEIVEFV